MAQTNIDTALCSQFREYQLILHLIEDQLNQQLELFEDDV